MFYQIFLSPQVKRIKIIINKHGVYELPNVAAAFNDAVKNNFQTSRCF